MADALSRIHVLQVQSGISVQPDWVTSFPVAYELDEEARSARLAIAQNDLSWVERDGLLWWKQKLFVPDLPNVRRALIREAHDT